VRRAFRTTLRLVIPAKAGIRLSYVRDAKGKELDPGFAG
jgi:hypothetical protein